MYTHYIVITSCSITVKFRKAEKSTDSMSWLCKSQGIGGILTRSLPTSVDRFLGSLMSSFGLVMSFQTAQTGANHGLTLHFRVFGSIFHLFVVVVVVVVVVGKIRIINMHSHMLC